MYLKVNYITHFHFNYSLFTNKSFKKYILYKAFQWIGSSAFSNSMRTEISENLSDKENILLYFDQNFRCKVKYVLKLNSSFNFLILKKKHVLSCLHFYFLLQPHVVSENWISHYDEANIFLADATIHLSLLNNVKLFRINFTINWMSTN